MISYKELIDPKNLFHSLDEVKTFCALAEAKEHLVAFLAYCEEGELYEYCAIIRDAIKTWETKSQESILEQMEL